jgi:hypothetical protein
MVMVDEEEKDGKGRVTEEFRRVKSDCIRDRRTYKYLVDLTGIRGRYSVFNSNCRTFSHGCHDEIIKMDGDEYNKK